MLIVVIFIVCEWQEFIACGIRKLAKRFAHAVSNLPGTIPFRTLRCHSNDRSEEERIFSRSQFYYRGVVNEERVSCTSSPLG
jgi:hypothetical protein